MTASLWDQHACLPLRTDTDVGLLTRYPSGSFVGVNVGYTPQSHRDALALVDHFRRAVRAHPDLELTPTVGDIDRAVAAGKIAVAFDLEDCGPLDGDLDNVHRFAELGVRSLQPTYNHANAAGCGCLDTDDTGLSGWGRSLIAEMNAAGMTPDGSHGSVRTGLDLCTVSAGPVIYSHCGMRAVWDHPRNITDEQAQACADTGGVVGITGVGIFLGPNTPTLEAMVRHLDYAVDLVGIEHVGVSTDFSFDHADFAAEMGANPSLFDDSYTRWGPIRWMPPETFGRLAEHLAQHGWSRADIAAVLGGNFLRVAAQTWRRL